MHGADSSPGDLHFCRTRKSTKLLVSTQWPPFFAVTLTSHATEMLYLQLYETYFCFIWFYRKRATTALSKLFCPGLMASTPWTLQEFIQASRQQHSELCSRVRTLSACSEPAETLAAFQVIRKKRGSCIKNRLQSAHPEFPLGKSRRFSHPNSKN